MFPLRHPDRSAIATQQEDRLRLLLNTLGHSNRFYRDKIRDSGIFTERDLLAAFRARFPYTTKAELQADQLAHPPYGTNLTYAVEWYHRYHQTSGTSGVPLRWLDEPESWAALVSHWRHILEAAQVTHADRLFFAFSFGPFIGFWLAFEAAAQMGCLCIPAGGMNSGRRVRLLLESEATVLCCTPTYALRLAEAALAEGLDLARSKVRLLLVAGEPGGSIPAVRQRLESAWVGARVFDHHGMTETGPVTFECPANPCTLHVMEDAFLAEIIDPETEQPAPQGQRGELVLTTLQRVGSPLLRYRTGDLVQASSRIPCSCGSYSLRLDGGILGRADDMVVIRGVNVYPSAVDEVVRRFGQVAEYQARVREEGALLELELTIETHPGFRDEGRVAAEIERELQNSFNLRIPVRTAPSGTLPRFEMKAQRWVR